MYVLWIHVKAFQLDYQALYQLLSLVVLKQILFLAFFLHVRSEPHQIVVCYGVLAQSFLEAVNERSGIRIKSFVARCILDIPLQCLR